jgi:hypothetical protein
MLEGRIMNRRKSTVSRNMSFGVFEAAPHYDEKAHPALELNMNMHHLMCT